MKRKGTAELFSGIALILLFILWTVLICTVDVRPVGVNGTGIGFASFNLWFHKQTGVHMRTFILTDWLGLVPVLVCMCFGVLGLIQWIRRKQILQVDADILILGLYYILVISEYLLFEIIPVNYRPILINGYMEASYPSSAVLLVLSVMPTLVFQTRRRVGNTAVKMLVFIGSVLFSAYMVLGRLICGAHWFTDIAGAVFLSSGSYLIYKGTVLIFENRKKTTQYGTS